MPRAPTGDGRRAAREQGAVGSLHGDGDILEADVLKDDAAGSRRLRRGRVGRDDAHGRVDNGTVNDGDGAHVLVRRPSCRDVDALSAVVDRQANVSPAPVP